MVVFIVAVETGPTKRSQRSSHVMTMEDEKAVGLATVVVPLRLIDAVGVGIIEGEAEALEEPFWATASAACINRSVEYFMFTETGGSFYSIPFNIVNSGTSSLYILLFAL
jgi:hypothetical protein